MVISYHISMVNRSNSSVLVDVESIDQLKSQFTTFQKCKNIKGKWILKICNFIFLSGNFKKNAVNNITYMLT